MGPPRAPAPRSKSSLPLPDLQALEDPSRHDQLRQFVRAVLRRLGAPDNELDDLVADVVAEAGTSRHRYDPAVASVATWLESIARHRLVDFRRRWRARDSHLVCDEDMTTELAREARATGTERRWPRDCSGRSRSSARGPMSRGMTIRRGPLEAAAGDKINPAPLRGPIFLVRDHPAEPHEATARGQNQPGRPSKGVPRGQDPGDRPSRGRCARSWTGRVASEGRRLAWAPGERALEAGRGRGSPQGAGRRLRRRRAIALIVTLSPGLFAATEPAVSRQGGLTPFLGRLASGDWHRLFATEARRAQR
jgi:Sigma-70 region 2